MSEIPDTIVLKRDRDLEGRGGELWVRRALFALLALVPLLALLNVFGQRPQTTVVTTAPASLTLYAPARIRSGLLWQARFRVRAVRELRKATLVLGPGWLEGLQVNTIEPSPVGQASANGRLSLDLGHIPAGRSFLLFMQFQTDPTNVGHRPQTVWLYDGSRRLLTLHHTITIFP
ncbi:MAG: hypothetical protein C5B48_06375 [Candidatus Rokuibacteriota bacterium]|nr:MAG: hypothetical protein C5B48_06375 [Candidatus Rokubacteria bacterium]